MLVFLFPPKGYLRATAPFKVRIYERGRIISIAAYHVRGEFVFDWVTSYELRPEDVLCPRPLLFLRKLRLIPPTLKVSRSLGLGSGGGLACKCVFQTDLILTEASCSQDRNHITSVWGGMVRGE